MAILFIGAFIATLIVLVFVYGRVINRLKGLPPGPPPLPFFGNILQLGDPVDETFWSWRRRYGPVFTVWMPLPTILIMRNKEIQEALVGQAEAYAGRPMHNEIFKILNGGHYGLVFQDNAWWKPQRRFALHVLRNLGVGSAGMQETVRSLTCEACEKLKEESGNVVDIKNHIMFVVANVVWNLAFGHSVEFGNPILSEVKHNADEMLRLQGHPFVFLLDLVPPFLVPVLDRLVGGVLGQIVHHKNAMNDVIIKELKVIEKTLDVDSSPRSYAEAFLQEEHRLKAFDDGEVGSFTRTQLLYAASDLWMAGFETTVTTLRYAFHYLIDYPEVQRKMQEEMDDKIGRDEDIRMESQRLLPYCSAVITEVQRLAILGPFGLFHHTLDESTVGGFRIPSGVDVMPQFQFSHNDPDLFPRPERFCPDRFLNAQGEFVKDPRVIPFNVGKRACLGEGLARMEIFLILTTLVRSFSFASPTPVPPKLTIVEGFVRSPAPYKIRVTARQ